MKEISLPGLRVLVSLRGCSMAGVGSTQSRWSVELQLSSLTGRILLKTENKKYFLSSVHFLVSSKASIRFFSLMTSQPKKFVTCSMEDSYSSRVSISK